MMMFVEVCQVCFVDVMIFVEIEVVVDVLFIDCFGVMDWFFLVLVVEWFVFFGFIFVVEQLDYLVVLFVVIGFVYVLEIDGYVYFEQFLVLLEFGW